MQSASAVAPAEGWPRAWPFLAAPLAAGLLAVALAFLPVPERIGNAIGNGLQFLAAAAAAWSCLAMARGLEGRARLGWRLLGLGAASWAAGQLMWSWFEVVRQEPAPIPSAADVGFLVMVPFVLVGILVLAGGQRDRSITSGLLLDGLLAALAAFVVAWPLGLQHLFLSSADRAAAITVVAYPVSDILLLGMTLGALMRGRRAWRSSLGFLYAGFAAIAIADTTLAFGALEGSYATGQLGDAGWSVGFLLIAAAARVPTHSLVAMEPRAIGRLVPLAAVLLGFIGFAVSLASRHPVDAVWRAAMAVLVLAAFARQWLFTREFGAATRERERAQALFNTIVDNAAEGILRTTPGGRILMANLEFARMLGFDSTAALTAAVPDMAALYVDPKDRQALLDVVAESGSVTAHEVRLRRRDGTVRWMSVNLRSQITPEGDLELHEFVRDITDTHLLAHDLRRTRRTLRVISQFNQALVRAGDETALLQGVCDSLTTEGSYMLAWVGLAQEDAERSVKPVAHSGFEEGYVAKVRASWSADHPHGQGPTGQTIRDGKTHVAQDILNDPRMAPWRADAVARGYGASCSLFLDLAPYGRGALMVYAAEPVAFGPDEVALLEELASDLAYGVVSLRERAKRIQVEEQSREVAALFNATVEASLEAIITMDPKGRVRGFNPAAERIFGYSRDEAMGKVLSDLIIPPEVRQAHNDGLARTLGTGTGPMLNRRVEVEAMRRDGGRIPVELTIIPIQVEGSKMFAGFLRDVTAEHGARQATDRLAAIVQSSHEAIFGVSLSGQVLSWNKGAEDVFGYTAEEAIGKGVDALMVPPDRMLECEEMLAALRRGEAMPRRDAERMRKGGQRIMVSVALAPLRDAHGQLTGGSVAAHDVTAVRRAAEALRESEARLMAAQRVAHVGSWELDLVKNELWWSEENYRIFGVEPGAFGATYDFFLKALHPDEREVVDQAYKTSVATRVPYGIEHRLVMPDGRVKWVYERCETQYAPNGEPLRSVGTTQDITELKKAEDARRAMEAKDQEVQRLSALNKMRMEFLSTAAHDLKTPLTPLKLQMAALRARGTLDAAQKASLEIMDRNVNRFQVLVEDMLDAARLQAGRLTLRREPVAFAPLVQEAVASFQESARVAGLQLEVALDPTVRIDADPAKCMQVLVNLISNAVKFTPSGGRVQVRLSGGETEAVLSVEDTGLGMDADQISRLFQAFVRLHEGQPGVAKGTGLGLYISKGIAEQHGGRLWAESEGPGHGSRFYLAWPLAAKVAVPGAKAGAEPARSPTNRGPTAQDP